MTTVVCEECGHSYAPAAFPGGMCPRCLLSGGAQDEPPDELALDELSPEELRDAVPGFRIEALLGRGGMGAVFRARQLDLDRDVAIKFIAIRDDDPAFGERFEREAKTMARLNHPNIVAVHSHGRTGGNLAWIVMEYVEGGDLAQIIAAGRIPEATAIGLVEQVCSALAFAHAQGCVHRDIKPGNILVDKHGRVKVADFGLVKLIGEHAALSALTLSFAGVGTALYAAPEQSRAGAPVDHRADIYAVGVMLYEMLTGEVPRGVFQSPSAKSGTLKRWDRVIVRAMDSRPDNRFPSTNDLLSELVMIRRKIESGANARRIRWKKRALVAAGVAVAAGATAVWHGMAPHHPAPTPTPPGNSTILSASPAHYNHTATRLRDGRALVVGGRRHQGITGWEGEPLPGVQLYDPASGTWTAGPGLATGRYLHTAALMADGRVLVAGGHNKSPLASVEIYDPATNSWSPAANLSSPRCSHASVVLLDGRVMVAGGVRIGDFLNSVEIYNPATKSWTSAPPMSVTGEAFTATVLRSGQVLVAGGYNRSISARAELFDPATGKWTRTKDLHAARHSHTATILPDDRVLIVGGKDQNGSTASAEVYNPWLNNWDVMPGLATARASHAAVLLENGRVLVTGGEGAAGTLRSAESFDPHTRAWTPSGHLRSARRGHTMTLLNGGQVFIDGGLDKTTGELPPGNAEAFAP